MTSPRPHPPAEAVRVSEILAALSFALDLTEGQPMGHALRTCLIGMRLADRLDLSLGDRRDLYYALLLKDVGCSSNSARVFELFGGDDRLAKNDLKRVDWSNYLQAAVYAMAHASPGAPWYERARRIAALAHAGSRTAGELVETRCVRGADIVRQLGFGPRVANAVRNLDEHWDGGGHPRGIGGYEIPMNARILCLAQTLEVFASLDGAAGALQVARHRSGHWFDPTLVSAAGDLERDLPGWLALDEDGLRDAVAGAEPGSASLLAGPGTLDRIAYGFAGVVDAKSPFTATHSRRVTQLAEAVGRRLGLEGHALAELRRAALLHDIGKLSVPNSILDKPGTLTSDEWEVVRRHPYYTLRVLEHVRGFRDLAEAAASHHERLDGSGYFRGLRGSEVPRGGQMIAVADVYDALSTPRPYRPALPREVTLRILEKDRDVALHADCLDALIEATDEEEGQDRLAEAA